LLFTKKVQKTVWLSGDIMSSTHVSLQDKIGYIRELLSSDQTEKALLFIDKNGTQNQEMKNALGVCLMRAGRIEQAVTVLRDLVFQNHICIPDETPPLYQANYATALLLQNYNQMAIEIIKRIPVNSHPYVAQLHQAIGQWQKSLPLLRQMQCLLGLYPSGCRVPMEFKPGCI